jgi:hypothetical protein
VYFQGLRAPEGRFCALISGFPLSQRPEFMPCDRLLAWLRRRI